MKFDFDNYDIHDLIDDWFESGFDIDANERMIKVHSLYIQVDNVLKYTYVTKPSNLYRNMLDSTFRYKLCNNTIMYGDCYGSTIRYDIFKDTYPTKKCNTCNNVICVPCYKNLCMYCHMLSIEALDLKMDQQLYLIYTQDKDEVQDYIKNLYKN